MCGIFGAVVGGGLRGVEKHRLNSLGDANLMRGTDAFGLIGVVPHQTIKILKSPGKYKLTKPVHQFYDCQASFWVGHTRNATSGSPLNNRNNHPIITKGFVGVHNGIVRETPQEAGVLCQTEVDSEIIFRLLDKWGVENFPIVLGWGAVVFVDRCDSTRLWAARSGAPLFYACVDNVTYLSSIPWSLSMIGGRPESLPNKLFCTFDLNGNLEVTKYPFKMVEVVHTK